jgi:hypothetical protein
MMVAARAPPLRIREAARSARPGPVVEPIEPFGVLALDGVTQGLPFETRCTLSSGERHSVEHIGDRQQ